MSERAWIGGWVDFESGDTNSIAIGSAPPANLNLWFNTTAKVFSIWYWGPSGSGGSFVPVSGTPAFGASPPASPAPGMSWIDATGRLWAYESVVWIEVTYPIPNAPIPSAGSLVASLSAPQSPAMNLLWLNPALQNLSQWNGTTWVPTGMRPPRNVKYLYTPGGIETTGTWTDGIRAGTLLHLAGCRGIDPITNTQVAIPYQSEAVPGTQRILQAFRNMKHLAESEGASIFDVVRLMVFLTNMFRDRPIVNAIQAYPEFWGHGPYPNRTILAVTQLNGTDLVGEWLSPAANTNGPGAFASDAALGTAYTGAMYVRSRGDICEAQATLLVTRDIKPHARSGLSAAILGLPGVSSSHGGHIG